MSGGGDRSCATCHPLNSHGVDGLPRARALGELRKLRNTPTIFNVRFNSIVNWDGKFDDISALADAVLNDPALMGASWPGILSTIRSDPRYLQQFEAIYKDGATKHAVLDALESYELSLTTPNSRFDKYLRGDQGALNDEERMGYQLFKSYGCVACHQGVNVGGNIFQKFGVFTFPSAYLPGKEATDPGRSRITRNAEDLGVFRVASLRNVAVTAPYFHDGSAATLDEAIDEMARLQLGRTLRPDDRRRIVLFLGTLTGDFSSGAATEAATGRR